MKEMEYTGTRKAEVLEDVTLEDGYRIVVMNLGSHPTAYVGVTKNKRITKSIPKMLNRIKCHGGVTYCKEKLNFVDEQIPMLWVGWDYAHAGDYCRFRHGIVLKGVKHTTDEMIKEAKSVVSQVRLMERGMKENAKSTQN